MFTYKRPWKLVTIILGTEPFSSGCQLKEAGISWFSFLFALIAFIQTCFLFSLLSVASMYCLGQPGWQTSLGVAEGSSRRTLHPPCVYRGFPDNEIRLELPPSLKSSLTYLSRADAPCPGGGILNRVPLHWPNRSSDMWSKMVAGAK